MAGTASLASLSSSCLVALHTKRCANGLAGLASNVGLARKHGAELDDTVASIVALFRG